MTPPIERPETAFFKMTSGIVMIYLLTTYLGGFSLWVVIAYFPLTMILAWVIEQIHDILRYRRYDEYYVDRRTGQVWWRSYFHPNPWDAGVVWVRMDMTESDVIKGRVI